MPSTKLLLSFTRIKFISQRIATSGYAGQRAARAYTSPSSRPLASPTMAKATGSNPSKDDILKWASKDGSFKRKASAFRNFISKEPGAEFPPEAGRYHLYVSYACPWAHRTMIVRKLKGLEKIIDFTSVHWHLGEKGWRFVTPDEQLPGENTRPDPVNSGFGHLQDIYFKVQPDYEGRYLVPTLYDFKQGKIVSNESSEILRMFYTEFDSLIDEQYRTPKVDLFPEALRPQIEETNEWTYDKINNGVYKSGFATTQEAYEAAVVPLFEHLQKAEEQLAASASEGPYYFGNHLTEADIRLYTTIVRFDPVYHQHFKCNLATIRDGFPNLHRWVRHLYWDLPAFHDTTDFEHIKKHYTKSHVQINPHSITPLGPLPDILQKDEEVPAVRAAIEGEARKKRKA